MRVLSILIVTFILLMSTAFSQVIQGEFIPSVNGSSIKEGDVFEATIRVWPIENVDLNQFKKLEKTILFSSLYMAQITSLGISQNNSDVIELSAIFIARSAKPTPVFNFKYNESQVELQLGGMVVNELKDQSEDFYILDQSINKSVLWTVIFLLILILIIVLLVKRRTIKEYLDGFKSNSEKKSKKIYSELFKNAEQRQDFEFLYENKDIWMNLLVEKTPAHVDFLKTINQYQFKKEWTPSEYEEVNSSFEIIRRSFEK